MKLTNGQYNGKNGNQARYRFQNEKNEVIEIDFESALEVFQTMAEDLFLAGYEDISDKLYDLYEGKSPLEINW